MAEWLVFAGETLTGPIEARDLASLRDWVHRGRNRLLPRAPGRRAKPVRLDELETTIEFSVVGRIDWTGTPWADPEQGIRQNLDHYRTLFQTVQDAATGESAIELHQPPLAWEGVAQVRNYAGSRTGPTTGTVLVQFVIAAGELDEETS